MNFRHISDMHTHSNCSFDGRDSVLEMYKKACEKGLVHIAVTDHFEAPFYFNQRQEYGDFKSSIKRCVDEVNDIKKKNAEDNSTEILLGLELGSALQDIAATNEILAFGEYDFILASLHNISGYKDFYWLDYTKYDCEKLFELYLKEISDLISWTAFDSLAHLTYPLRYMIGASDIDKITHRLSDAIDAVLSKLAKNNKALEINTSGLRHKMNKTLPSKDIIKRFKALGGKYITIGSDAHNTDDLAKGVAQGMQIAKECGFDQYTVFKSRQPCLITIE